jgi:hypothetical protein
MGVAINITLILNTTETEKIYTAWKFRKFSITFLEVRPTDFNDTIEFLKE